MKFEIANYDKAKVLCALYNMSTVDVDRLSSYRPGGMFIGEAIVLLDEKGDKYSYVYGRPVMVDLSVPEFDLTTYHTFQPMSFDRAAWDHMFTCPHVFHGWTGHILQLSGTIVAIRSSQDGLDWKIARAPELGRYGSTINPSYLVAWDKEKYDQLVQCLAKSMSRLERYHPDEFRHVTNALGMNKFLQKPENLEKVTKLLETLKKDIGLDP